MTDDQLGEIEIIQVAQMALLVTVDAEGQARYSSGLGFTRRQQAELLQTLADNAHQTADEAGEPTTNGRRPSTRIQPGDTSDALTAAVEAVAHVLRPGDYDDLAPIEKHAVREFALPLVLVVQPILEANAIGQLARLVYNGAPDPCQEFYDHGVAPWLEEQARIAAGRP